MTIALVCPDSFQDYDAVEKALLENKTMASIVCATTNAYNLAMEFASKFNIPHKHIKSPGKTARLRKMVDIADKVVLFEYSDYDSSKVKFSRTQYALSYLKQIGRALQYIEYDRTIPKKNATYLFEQKNGFHHSESRWNTIAQFAFRWMGENKISMDVFSSEYEDKMSKEWLKKKDEQIGFTDWSYDNTIVEGNLNHTVFSLDKDYWNKDFTNIKPDIVHISDQQIVIIEVKTIKSSVQRNIKRYRALIELLEEHNPEKTVKLYYLLSYGHNPNSDWKHLNEDNILLWEDLFSKIVDSDLKKYIHSNLSYYTLMPEWL